MTVRRFRNRPSAIAAFAIAYAVALLLSERAYGSAAVPSPFWLPDSILLSALLLARTEDWWAYIVVIWPIRWLLGAPGTPQWFLLVSIANDTLKGIGAAWILRRLLGDRIRLDTLREFEVFLAVAAGAIPLLSALAAAPLRHLLGDPLWAAGYRWFLGDALAQVIVTPMILYWCTFQGASERRVELLLLMTLLVAASFYAVVVTHDSDPRSLLYLPVPFLIWAAVRHRPAGTASAIGLMATVSMISASRGTGLFPGDAAHHSIVPLQLFLLTSAVSLLPLAILIAERETLCEREAAFNGRLLQAQEQERARLAQELHDDIAQRMALLQIGIERFSGTADLSAAGRSQIGEFAGSAAEISSDIRSLSHELHPSTLRVVGLDVALRGLCREFSEQHRLQVQYTCSDLPADVERGVNLCLYRIAQEALHNVVKHSGATDAVVRLSRTADRLVLSVVDSGSGFDLGSVDARKGLGLTSMRERLRPVAGNLEITSRPGAGTEVRVEVPNQLLV